MLGFLYLYPNYDTDLINLYYSVGEKNFNTIIRDALRALIRPYYIPKFNIYNLPNFTNIIDKENKRITIAYSIRAKKDEDVRILLQKVKKGQINVFVKMAVRFHIGVKLLSGMLDIDIENPIIDIPKYIPPSTIIPMVNSYPILSEQNINIKNNANKNEINTDKDLEKPFVEEEKTEEIDNNKEEFVENISNDYFNKTEEDFDALSILERMMG